MLGRHICLTESCNILSFKRIRTRKPRSQVSFSTRRSGEGENPKNKVGRVTGMINKMK